MTKVQNRMFDEVMELIDRGDLEDSVFHMLILNMMVARCHADTGKEPPKNWNAEKALDIVWAGMKQAYDQTIANPPKRKRKSLKVDDKGKLQKD